MVYRKAVDVRSHDVLESKTDELNAMCPAQLLFEQLPDPEDQLSLAGPRVAVN